MSNQGAQDRKFPETTFQTIGDKQYEIAIAHTGAYLAKQIVNVNRKTIFTPVNLIGLPGFGKTTGTHQLVSEIKKVEPSYIILWYNKNDLKKIDKILRGLPKYQNYILVFDDVSYLLDEISNEDKSRILHELTIVRETLDPERKKARCILMLDFHYSYAVPKAFRQSNFSIQFSITDEERTNYLKRVGYDRYKQRKISRFVNLFEKAYLSDYFTMRLRSGKEITYQIDHPYRPALVFKFSKIHFWLFHPVNDMATGPKKKTDAPDLEFWQQMVKKYGFSRVLKVLRMYTFSHTGAPVIPAVDKKIWNHIRDQNARNNLPLKELVAILKSARNQPYESRENKLMDSLQKLQTIIVQSNQDVTTGLAITKEQFMASLDDEVEGPEDEENEGDDDFSLDDSVMQEFGNKEDEN